MKFIAELCQNHGGNVKLLQQMLHAAAGSGATHVKIQHIYTKNLTFRPIFETGFQGNHPFVTLYKRSFLDEYHRLQKLELTDGFVREFVQEAIGLGLIPLTTCFSLDELDNIANQGFNELKIASYDCASYELIRRSSSIFSHIYISTGASYVQEIIKALDILRLSGCMYTPFHCITKYPTALTDLHLARIEWLSQLTGCNLPVGYSDHTSPLDTELIASKLAIFIGAKVIERHFTIPEAGVSKDFQVSINPNQLKELTDFSLLSREFQQEELDKLFKRFSLSCQQLLGSHERVLSSDELSNRAYYRGRFASPRVSNTHDHQLMQFNWEEA